ncbi:hypothetical protein SISNIDRAFT_417076, partial [Sistotremastrum niveocremeum HHB9708]
ISVKSFQCHQCHEILPIGKARSHVGKHILKRMRGVVEALSGDQIETPDPCGFCGRSGLPECSRLYLTAGANPQPKSDCQHFYKFMYQRALISTDNTPSTNVPILCSIIGCTHRQGKFVTAIWKYNAKQHLEDKHPGYLTDGLAASNAAPIPIEMLHAMEITDDEERRMGIPTQYRPAKPVLPPIQAKAVLPRSRKRPHTATEVGPERPNRRVRLS